MPKISEMHQHQNHEPLTGSNQLLKEIIVFGNVWIQLEN